MSRLVLVTLVTEVESHPHMWHGADTFCLCQQLPVGGVCLASLAASVCFAKQLQVEKFCRVTSTGRRTLNIGRLGAEGQTLPLASLIHFSAAFLLLLLQVSQCLVCHLKLKKRVRIYSFWVRWNESWLTFFPFFLLCHYLPLDLQLLAVFSPPADFCSLHFKRYRSSLGYIFILQVIFKSVFWRPSKVPWKFTEASSIGI